MVLRALSFDDAGTFVGPAARDFWERVFDDERIPDNPERELRGIDDTPLIDAAYVLAATCNEPPPTGRTRLRVLAFVQRVFRDHDGRDLPEVLVAARAVVRYPMLMLSVERMGIADAGVYASLARAAARLERIRQPLQLRNALSQFQGAVAIVERAALAGAMTPDVAGDALLALAGLPVTRNGQFNGAVGGWFVEHLLPGLGVRIAPAFDSDAMDQQLLAALAGAADVERPVVEWEGLTYRFDRRTAQFERFIQTRDRLGGNRLDAIVALAATAAALANGSASDPAPLVEQLERSWTSIRTPRVGIHVPNTRSVSYEDTVRPIVEDLQENLRRGRLRRLPDVARRLGPVLDVLLADLLRTLPYVVHVSNSYGVRLMGDDIAARHEFGVRIGDAAERARAPWSMPRGGSAPPAPFHRLGEFWIAPEDDDRFTGAWHVYGALLSLDLALARFHLPRLAGVIPSDTPAVLPTEENYFAHGATLFNPARVTRSAGRRDCSRHPRWARAPGAVARRSVAAAGCRARSGARCPAAKRARVDAAAPSGCGGSLSFADRAVLAGPEGGRERGGPAAARLGRAGRLAGWLPVRAHPAAGRPRPFRRLGGAPGVGIRGPATCPGRNGGRAATPRPDRRRLAAAGDA